MAIRNFRKNMKPVIWFIVILMVISGLGFVFSTLGNGNRGGVDSYGFKLNGKKIPAIDVERTIQLVNEQYAMQGIKNVPDKAVEILGFTEVINKVLTLDMADKEKIKVSTKEVADRYKLEEEQKKMEILASIGIPSGANSLNNITKENLPQAFKDWAEKSVKSPFDGWNNDELKKHYGSWTKSLGDDAYKNWLTSRGYTKDIFKEEIKNNLKMEKFFNSLTDKAKAPTDAEIKGFYEANKALRYPNTTLEQEKNNIIRMLKEEEAVNTFYILLNDARKSAKIEDINERYKPYQEVKIKDVEGIPVTNLDMAKLKLSILPYLGGDVSKLDEQVNELMEKQMQMVRIAKEKGVTVNESFPLDRQFQYYYDGLYEKVRGDIKPTEEELKEHFQATRALYNTPATLDTKIAVMDFEHSKEDLEANKVEAEKLLKEVTVENFAEMAKKYGQDGSAQFGGSLGEFTKDKMVPEFSEAVFKGEVGKVYPELVATQFGQHIIWIESRDDANNKAKASHILLMPKYSEESLKNIDTKIKDTIGKLTSGNITFEKLQEVDKNILYTGTVKGVTTDGYIRELGGSNKELSDAVFAANLNEVSYKMIEDRAFIFQKIAEVKATEAQYEDFKDKVMEDYLNKKSMEEMQKVLQENSETPKEISEKTEDAEIKENISDEKEVPSDDGAKKEG